MSYFVGVDIGSLTTKAVLIDEQRLIIGQSFSRSGFAGKEVALRLVGGLLAKAGLEPGQVSATVATGYGRITYPADREVSEISCQARAIAHLFPGARTVIDIGGQDSKVIKILQNGRVLDFAMNDKCAAGTGRFLEVMAQALEVQVEDLGRLAGEARESCPISSTCTVFAESEVISHIARGAKKSDIVAGACEAVAARVITMAGRVGIEPDLIFTGGVAHNAGVVKALSEKVGLTVTVPPEPEITAALGAALFAAAM